MAAEDRAPRVAVIVPCYNDGSTLRETLASLEQQEPFELVVVDDGSTDERTIALLDELAEQGIRVVRHENRGLAVARMTGVASTAAPYVFPLDADDMLVPGGLTALADALDADPEAVAAWGDTETFGEVALRVQKARALDPWAITYVNDVPGRALVRREALVAVGGWQRDGYEDWDLWLRFATRGWRGVHVGRVTSRYRIHGGRGWAYWTERVGAVAAELGEAHRPLYERRRANWRRSSAPWRLRILLPLLEAAPGLSLTMRYRLRGFATHPLFVLRVKLARLRRRLTKAGT